MATPVPNELTQLLLDWNNGDQTALDRLAPLVHAELRRLAKGYLRHERNGHSLQTTALINEAYVRLIDAKWERWQNRSHFFGVAAGVMRRILVDLARTRNYQKRGGGIQHLAVDVELVVSPGPDCDVVALDEALTALAKLDQRKARVVEMRFFGGLREAEIASVLNVSSRTVRGDWRMAKSWLLRRLREGPADE